MPRVTQIMAEVGSTGRIESVSITADAGADITRAIELEHPCSDDSSCDIAAALENGFPFSAAYLLSGATETPLLDAVCRVHRFNPSGTYDAMADWDAWTEWFGDNARECPSCGAFSFDEDAITCGNCLHELVNHNEDCEE